MNYYYFLKYDKKRFFFKYKLDYDNLKRSLKVLHKAWDKAFQQHKHLRIYIAEKANIACQLNNSSCKKISNLFIRKSIERTTCYYIQNHK